MSTDVNGDPIPNPAIWEMRNSALVIVGKRKRRMEVAVVRDGTIVAAFPNDREAKRYMDAAARIERLEWEVAQIAASNHRHRFDVHFQVDRVHALQKALRFYADRSRYQYDNDCCPEVENPGRETFGEGILQDEGQRARAALEE